MSLILLGLTVGIMTPPLWYTIIKQMFYKEKHLTLSYLSSSPYVVHEGIKLANSYNGLWELCVCTCVSVFPGACTVCAGSEEAKALIKEHAWYRDTSLTAWGHAT